LYITTRFICLRQIRSRHGVRRDEIIYSFAGISARLCKLLKRGGPMPANENHQPYRAKAVPILSHGMQYRIHFRPAGQYSFCPSSPDGQKKK